MVGKNNSYLRESKSNDHFKRFSLRKLNIGVVSVAIAAGFYFGNGATAQAATTTAQAATTETSTAITNEQVEHQDSNTISNSNPAINSGTAPDSKAITASASADSGQPMFDLVTVPTESNTVPTESNTVPTESNNDQKPQSNVDLSLWKWQTADSTKGYNGIKLTGYTGAVDENATIYVPNNVDFIKAGKIKAGQSVYLGDLSNIRNCRRLIIDNHDGGKVIFVRNPTGSIPTFTSETLEYIDVSGADTHLLTDMSKMFFDAPNLKRIVGLENFDTSHVQSFELMFGWDPQLMDIGDLSKWDVSKVENFNEMFQLDKNLTNIGNLDNWDVSKAKSFENMFMGTEKLKSIGSLKDWQVKNVTDMPGMFLLSSIVGVDMSNWDVSSLKDVSYMFAYNYNPRFTNLELPNFSKAKLENWLQAFLDDNYLENINISGWDFVDDLNYNKEVHDAADGADNLFDKWLSTSGVNGLTVNTIGAKWPSDLDLMPENSDFDYNPQYGVTGNGISRLIDFEGADKYIDDIKYSEKPTPLVVLTDNQTLLGYNKQRSESNRPNEITLVNKNSKVIGQYQMPIFYTSIDDIKKQISQYEDEFTQNYRKQNNDPKATFTFTLVDPETHQELTEKNLTPAQLVMATYLVRQNAKATVTYIDQTTGKTLTVKTLKGHTLEDTGYNTASDIEHYVDNGYALVGDTSKGAKIIFDDDDAADQAYTVTLKHGTVTVTPSDNVTEGNPINKDANGAKWPAGATKSVLQHDVKRNVTYVIANGKQTAPASVNDSLHYEAAATVDKVTGQVVKTVWSNAQDFKDVATPAVKGYTADKQNVSDKNIAHDHADIKHYVDNGYALVGDTSKGAKIIFDDDDAADQAYTVTLKHGTVTVTPGDPKMPADVLPDNPGKKYPSGVAKDDLNKTVKRTINITTPDGKTQTAEFTRSATVDEVTDEVTYGPWSKNVVLESVDVPNIPGYVPSASVPEITVTPNDQDMTINITYKKLDSGKAADQGGNASNGGSTTGQSAQNGHSGQTQNNAGAQQLPQTGNANNEKGALGLAGAMFAAGLGLGFGSKKKCHED
ncbi:mucin-binding protein [Limosilactobacillus reuteri]|uniref:mucin-binding protein n=1 Tax=Limosilactobacillus reuteri TaxID=1598 RepID=UPI001780E3BF|nr:BspA family leucine-rich repeat surface protein [Limosilactobacillus reuteri]